MTDRLNQLMNDKGVYRTAPATPGLLTRWGSPADNRPSLTRSTTPPAL